MGSKAFVLAGSDVFRVDLRWTVEACTSDRLDDCEGTYVLVVLVLAHASFQPIFFKFFVTALEHLFVGFRDLLGVLLAHFDCKNMSVGALMGPELIRCWRGRGPDRPKRMGSGRMANDTR